jgi:hypothetical protein
MNMFRDLAMMFCIFVGVSLMVSNPLDWKIVSSVPSQVAEAITFLVSIRPFSSIVCFALALALFMTRLKY